MAYTKITDVSSHFVKKGDTIIFTGNKLEIHIPFLYTKRKLFKRSENGASVLGIIQLVINDSLSAQMMCPAMLKINYSTIETKTIDNDELLILTLNRDDVFIRERSIIKDSSIVYDIFMTFIALGKIPATLDYSMIHTLFDKTDECAGLALNTNHAIFELIFAHMYRDKDDPYKFYRHTQMKSDPIIVPLHQISHGPESTSARIIGSYLKEGLVSSLIDDADTKSSPIENMLRV